MPGEIKDDVGVKLLIAPRRNKTPTAAGSAVGAMISFSSYPFFDSTAAELQR